MRDDESRPVLCQVFQRLLDHPLTLVIQGTRGLVEDEHGRILQKDPGNAQPLLLPAGELYAALTDIGVITFRQRHNEIVRVGFPRRCEDFRLAGIGFSVADILDDRPGEKIDVLLDHANIAPQGTELDIPDVDPIQGHLSLADLIETWNQRTECCLAYARGTHQCNRLAGGDP